jgi:hypothetical protein
LPLEILVRGKPALETVVIFAAQFKYDHNNSSMVACYPIYQYCCPGDLPIAVTGAEPEPHCFNNSLIYKNRNQCGPARYRHSFPPNVFSEGQLSAAFSEWIGDAKCTEQAPCANQETSTEHA